MVELPMREIERERERERERELNISGESGLERHLVCINVCVRMHACSNMYTPTHASMNAHISHTHIHIDDSLTTDGLVLSVAGACQISPRSLPPFCVWYLQVS